MLLNTYECIFGHTIEAGEPDADGLTYDVKKKGGTDGGIKVKSDDNEILTMFLVPESSNCDFAEIVEMNKTAIERLGKLEQNFEITSKTRFLKKLNEMIVTWVTENDPLKRAKDLFTDLVCAQFPEHKTLLRLGLREILREKYLIGYNVASLQTF